MSTGEGKSAGADRLAQLLLMLILPLLALTSCSSTPDSDTLFGFWAGNDAGGQVDTPRSNYDRVTGYLGEPQAYRMFHPDLPPPSFRGSPADFGPPVVVSFKASPAEVLAGVHDARLAGWFASIPRDRTVWWSYWHEPENDIELGAFTAAEYRAAWEHIIELAPRRDNLRATLILMEYTLRKPTRNVADYVPSGLDVLGWDAYLTRGSGSPERIIAATKKVSKAYDLGYAIAETAVAPDHNLPGLDHADTVKALVDALHTMTQGAEFVTWFETYKSDGDWRMRPYEEAVAEWRQ